MSKVISFVNQKGGVAKTSSSTIMAYLLVNDYHKKVCLIDFDAQANATRTMGIEEELNKNREAPIMLEDLQYTIADILNEVIEKDVPPKRDNYVRTLKGVDVIPSNQSLCMFESTIATIDFEREFILKKFVDSIREDYDYIIIDSLPKLGTQLINVLVASDDIIIPTNPAQKSIDGFYDLLKKIQQVQKRANSDLKVAGILITMANEKTNSCLYLQKKIANSFSEYYIYKSIIPYVKVWEEGDMFGQLWVERKREHKASQRYIEFVKEYLEREK